MMKNLNKRIAIFMCIVMVIGILPVYAFADNGLSDWTYNVLREVCSNFNPKDYKDESVIELKINELCEMGIDPIQLLKALKIII